MNVSIHTLGCKVNQYESQAVMSMLEEQGFQSTPQDEIPDVIIINSCTVTSASDAKVRQIFRRFRREQPSAVMVLTGCMPQAFPDIADRFDEADIIIGTKNRKRLPEYIMSCLSSKQRIVDISPHESGESFESMSIASFDQHTRAFLKIQDGCNRFCSYCIIPYARGRVRSKPLADIEAEVARLCGSGHREIVLTGINLPAYGQDLGLQLCDAVEVACQNPDVQRVRLGSLEPERLTEEVISRFKAQEKLCPQFHISLQSGCDETLKRMNRHYSSDDYRQTVRRLREAYENPAITTDIIVGFPGETEQEFEDSLAFAKEIGFARTHVFPYSPRPGTKAFDFPDQISKKEKDARSRRMIQLIKESQHQFFLSQLASRQEVLFEEALDERVYQGYTMNYTAVRVKSEKDLQGQILDVELLKAEDEYCIGQICP